MKKENAMAEKKKNKYTMNLTEGPILKQIVLFSLPLVASSILQLMFNAVDVMVVGQFAGDNALAAVGSNGSIINLITNVFMGLGVGVNVLVARFFAGKREEELRKTVHTAVSVSLICGVVLAVLGGLAAKQILIWTQSPPEVINLATLYLRIYFLGMPASMVYNFSEAVLRGVGDTKRPLAYLSFAGLLNLIFNLIFVIVFHMGVAGVAVATIISQCVSALLVLRCLAHETGAIRLQRKYMGVDKKILLQMVRIGVPAGIQSSMFSLSNVVVQSSINSFGKVMVAGNAAAQNIEGFLSISMKALSQATVAFVSQNMGAGKIKRISKALGVIVLCTIVLDGILGNLVFLCGKPLLGLYSDSAEVIKAGMIRISIACMPHVIYGLMDVMTGAIRGLGRSVMPMIVSLLGVCVFRMIWVYGLRVFYPGYTIDKVYIAYPISWGLTLIAHSLCFWYSLRKKQKEMAEA